MAPWGSVRGKCWRPIESWRRPVVSSFLQGMEPWHSPPPPPQRRRPREEAIAIVLATMRDGRFSDGVACPRCEGRRVQRWGTSSGRQRHRCLGCGRTFNELTGTPAAYLKKIELLPDYGSCMAEGLSVRKAGARLGIDPSTALRWRHRLLRALAATADADPASKLSGWIEVSTRLWFPESFKGRPVPDRAARSRGPRYRIDYEGPRANVLTACDRHGNVLTALLPRSRSYHISTEDIEQALVGRVQGSPVLTSIHGRFGACARIARSRPGWRYQQVGGGIADGPDPSQAHVRTVRAYQVHLRRWIARFRGVATRYLPLYLSWHRALHSMRDHAFQIALLRWPVPASGFG